MLRLFNTRTKRVEEFIAWQDSVVGLYTCGPTVYAPAHLGNLRSYVFSDILRRALALNGYTVKQVMNITDVGHLTSDADTGEDKMEQAAKEQDRSAREIAAENERLFWQDIKRLNILSPEEIWHAASPEPIAWQIALIQKLTDKGCTYQIDDGVYFDTSTFPRYGQLSGQKLTEKKAGARVAVTLGKKHPADFALWKFSPPGQQRQMEWPSPWGVGWPGWHIECSAISMHELGEQFDIHTGGIDHIPVHHENEIAQSEAATGKHPFVNFWLHGEFLIMPGKRMGKSEGNAVTLNDVMSKGIDPLAFRYLCLQIHYRQKLEFSWEALTSASEGLRNIYSKVSELGAESKIGCAEFEREFREAIDDDLNTAKALAVLQAVLKSDYPIEAKRKTIEYMDQVLGLQLIERGVPIRIPSDVRTLLDERETARVAKDFVRSDLIRQTLAEKGWLIEDSADGPKLRKV